VPNPNGYWTFTIPHSFNFEVDRFYTLFFVHPIGLITVGNNHIIYNRYFMKANAIGVLSRCCNVIGVVFLELAVI
jgi:hypothetical protein